MDIKDLNLEKIEKYDLQIYQDDRFFKFGVDAFCLAEFTKRFVKKKGRYIDLCSGTGVVGIIVSKLLDLDLAYFVELNPYYVQVNDLNIRTNGLVGEVINEDIRNLPYILDGYSFDFITINPPYMAASRGLHTSNIHKDLAKIEPDDKFLEDVFKVSHALLNDKGQLFMVHRVERLADIFIAARENRMEPKTIQYIRNKGSRKASLVLIRFVKNGNVFLDNLDDYEIGG